MKYKHIILYWFKGLSEPADREERKLVFDSAMGFRSLFTNNPDTHCFEVDQSLAIANYMANNLFGGKFQSGDYKEHLPKIIHRIQDSRRKKYQNGLYLVCITEGEAKDFQPEFQTETDEFVYSIGNKSKEDLVDLKSKSNILALTSAILLTETGIPSFDQVINSYAFIRDDGKPFYYHTASATLNSYSSPRLTSQSVDDIKSCYQRIKDDNSLERSSYLMSLSFQSEDDKLRSFLTAWAALETLTKKLFILYEPLLFRGLSREGQPKALDDFYQRIQNVMNSNYGLTDRFRYVSSILSPDSADRDSEFFKKTNRLRNELHQDDLTKYELPISKVRFLVQKYLNLHLSKQ